MARRKPGFCVLGIDPGLANCGYALLHTHPLASMPRLVALGVVHTDKGVKPPSVAADNVRRCIELATNLQAIIAMPSLTGLPPVVLVCVESMSFPRSASAAAKASMCWGVIVDNAVRWGVPILQQSPQIVKRHTVGRINATKKQVERAMIRRYKATQVEPHLVGVKKALREHPFDALAVATSGLISPEGRKAIACR